MVVPTFFAATSTIASVSASASRESNGAVRVVRDAAALDASLEDGSLAAVLHFEGAEAIDPGLERLAGFHDAGLRSLGLTDIREGVRIPYRKADGTIAPRWRLRTALKANDGSRWRGNSDDSVSTRRCGSCSPAS